MIGESNNKVSNFSPSSSPPSMAPSQNQNNNRAPLRCPRCESSNTKFCYYNNYSLTQPRHFCKACKRYWTRGGTLRNVPVGGGCRKNKRIKKSSASAVVVDPAAKSPSLLSSQTANCFDSNLNLNSFLFGLPSVAAPTYDLQPQLNQFQLGFDTNDLQQSGNFLNDYSSSSSLLPYQNCMQLEREVKLEAGSINAIEPWQIPNYSMNNPLESLAGSGDSSYLYWNSTAVGSAGWPK